MDVTTNVQFVSRFLAETYLSLLLFDYVKHCIPLMNL